MVRLERDRPGSGRRCDHGIKIAGTDMRVWFFILAFLCIGLDLRLGSIREAGIRPVLVFGAATVLNLALALVLASVIFAGFKLT